MREQGEVKVSMFPTRVHVQFPQFRQLTNRNWNVSGQFVHIDLTRLIYPSQRSPDQEYGATYISSNCDNSPISGGIVPDNSFAPRKLYR